MSAVSKVKFSALQTAPSGPGRSDHQQADFALRELLRSIREVAAMLGAAPGRMTLIFLSAGFNFTSDRQNDFQDTLDVLNKANVGVYPVDPAGLTSMAGTGQPSSAGPRASRGRLSAPTNSGGGGAGTPVLYALAAKTGGFPVISTNDLAGGMERVAAETSEYYLLGYAPPHPAYEGGLSQAPRESRPARGRGARPQRLRRQPQPRHPSGKNRRRGDGSQSGEL